MLINTEIKINVTNDGKINNTEVTTNVNQDYKDVLLAIKFAEKALTDMFFSFCAENKITDKEKALELYSTITLETLYATKES